MAIWKYDDSTLYYVVLGEGKPLIFLHGWGHMGGAFNVIADSLKNKFRCYLLDLPGFGNSSIPSKTWDSYEFADAIKRFIEDMNLDDVVIIGHSFGGKIGVLTTTMIKNRIKKLILIDSTGIRPPMTCKKFFKIYFFKSARFVNNSGILFGLGDRIYDKIERFSGSADYLNAGQMRDILKKIVQEDISSDLLKIECPTLILWGEKDTATPIKDAHKMNKLIKDSKLIIYPNVGHHLPIDVPHQVAHHIKEFVG
jgi:pimeloyl-ACP methyl ester carboxylesterase